MDTSTTDRQQERSREVSAAIAGIRTAMDAGPSIENLEKGKAQLIALAARRDLFTFEDFPLPEDDAMECSYLIHEDEDGGYSLYVNSGAPHQYYAPHDHGKAWAIIAGVRGRERHQLYLRRSDDEPGDGPLVWKNEIICAPGGGRDHAARRHPRGQRHGRRAPAASPSLCLQLCPPG